jgi:hypothetical protein
MRPLKARLRNLGCGAIALALAVAAFGACPPAHAANDLPGVNVDGGNARIGASLAPGGGVQVGPVRPLRVAPGGVRPVRVKPSISGRYPVSCTPMHDAAGQCRPGRL